MTQILAYYFPRFHYFPCIAVALTLLFLYTVYTSLKGWSRKRPLPPGPPGLPFIGNVFDIPATDFWVKYRKWSKDFGSDVIYLNMAGTPVIILNSSQAIRELLDRRSSIYSCRPVMPMMTDLIGYDWFLGFMPYGPRWKERRALFQRVFHPSKMHLYRPSHVTAMRTLLKQLLEDPQNFLKHSRRLAGAFILSATYGIDADPGEDKYIQRAERGMAAMAAAGTGTTYLVDFLHFLKYVPSWFPGAGFKRQAREWRKSVVNMGDGPFEYVKAAMASGKAVPCAATETLGEYAGPLLAEKESVIRDTLGAVYVAGSDTVVSSYTTFILAMLQNPDIQRKAQEAIDASISLANGLPDYTEYGKIPYVDAIVREVLRWRPAGPVGGPRRLIKDDDYNGYHIPAGATVIPNSWAILYDPEIYGPNPSLFDPSRFLDKSQTSLNPDIPIPYEAFGYGRRICPGLHIAIENLWLTVVSILSVFDIKPMEGLSPEERSREGMYSSGLIVHPLPFKCRFVPRSAVAVQAVKNG